MAGDLTVNGLISNGTTKYLDTLINPSLVWPQNASPQQAGMSVYNVTGNNNAEYECGSAQGGNNLALAASNAGNLEFQCYGTTIGTDRISVANALWTGFTTGNRTSTVRLDAYIANSVTPFNNINGFTAGAGENGTPAVSTMTIFALQGVGQISTKRLSYAAIHFGMSSAQAQAHFNAVQAFRVALGGGFV